MGTHRLLAVVYFLSQWFFSGIACAEMRRQDDRVVTRIAFGSCANQSAPQPIWTAILGLDPDLFIWLGDNIYADAKLPIRFIGNKRNSGPWKNTPRFWPISAEEMEQRYMIAKNKSGYEALRKTTQIIGTWDDHDYGLNDAGKEFSTKEISQKLMLDFFDEPKDSPRRMQKGVYASYTYGPLGKRVKVGEPRRQGENILNGGDQVSDVPGVVCASVQEFVASPSRLVILLDTRYHRDPLFSDGAMLGETQWTWLEQELKSRDAQINIIASSIQVISNVSAVVQPFFHVESWSNFPKEQERLYRLIAHSNASGVLFISGDVHFCEITRYDCGPMGYPLYDLTSSGLTQAVEELSNPIVAFVIRFAAWIVPNTMRVYSPNCRYKSCVYGKRNFGSIEINWDSDPVMVSMQVRDVLGRPVSGAEVPLTMLQPGAVNIQPLHRGELRRHCSLDVDLPWTRKYLLAYLFFGSVIVLMLAPCFMGYFTLKTLRSRRRREPNQKPD